MSVIVLVDIEAKHGRTAEAIQIIKNSQQVCLSMKGCVGFEILRDQEDEHKFSFIERWSSLEAHKAFLDQLMGNEEFVESMEVFTSGPNIRYFMTCS